MLVTYISFYFSRTPRLTILRYKVLNDGPRCYEWVDVDVLRQGMERAFRQTCPREVLVRWDGWELHCLLALIGLTGTDYSRGLPYVGPRKVWSMLSKILPVLTSES